VYHYYENVVAKHRQCKIYVLYAVLSAYSTGLRTTDLGLGISGTGPSVLGIGCISLCMCKGIGLKVMRLNI
jgi:hypothetical protein